MESSQRSWCHMVSLGSKELKYGHYSCTMVGVLTLSYHIQKYWGHMHAIRQRLSARGLWYITWCQPQTLQTSLQLVPVSAVLLQCPHWYRVGPAARGGIVGHRSTAALPTRQSDSDERIRVCWLRWAGLVMPLQSLLSFYFWSILIVRRLAPVIQTDFHSLIPQNFNRSEQAFHQGCQLATVEVASRGWYHMVRSTCTREVPWPYTPYMKQLIEAESIRLVYKIP